MMKIHRTYKCQNRHNRQNPKKASLRITQDINKILIKHQNLIRVKINNIFIAKSKVQDYNNKIFWTGNNTKSMESNLKRGFDQQMLWTGGEVTTITREHIRIPKPKEGKHLIWFQDEELSIRIAITSEEERREKNGNHQTLLELCLITKAGIEGRVMKKAKKNPSTNTEMMELVVSITMCIEEMDWKLPSWWKRCMEGFEEAQERFKADESANNGS